MGTSLLYPVERVPSRIGAPSDPHRGAGTLRIGLLNLMPDAPATHAQFARLLLHGPQAVRLHSLRLDAPRGRAAPYLLQTARRWREAISEGLDGLIVTGAPVETLPFEAVTYWAEFCALIEAARARLPRTLYICWSAQAALWHAHRVPKHALPRKAFGVFRQEACSRSPLLEGLGASFPAPVSRHTEVREADLPPSIAVLARSNRSGLCLLAEEDCRTVYMFNHLEYDPGTLQGEYERDRAAGRDTGPPALDRGLAAPGVWLPAGRRFFRNWLADAARCGLPGAVERRPA
jgi:homoserine O-succinyltransferase